MDEQEKNKDLELSPEEQKAEEEVAKEVNEDELREKLDDDMGLDPDEQSDLLDKLVEREKTHREKLFGAIKQKRSWREKAQASVNSTDNPKKGNAQDKKDLDIDELVDRKLNERLEKQDLDSLTLTDDLKAEVKDLAKLKGISVREAAQHPYILNRKEEAEREQRIQNATPKRSNKGSYAASYDPSKPLDPADFDFNSDEGIKAWNEAKAARRKHSA